MNVIILFGEIISPVKRSRDACQFSLKTTTGLFHIKVKIADAGPLKKICEEGKLRRGQQVAVVATPCSFISSRCNSHHVYFEARTVTVIDSDQDSPTE